MTWINEPPFPDETRTGRSFITPCCTVAIREFRSDSALWLARSVLGKGWSEPWKGSIEQINETGTLVDADGREREIRWSAARDAHVA